MRQSQLFTKTIKELPKDETSFNAQILLRAGFISKESAGIYSYLPLGLKVLNKISGIIREEMDKIGGQEILMPALTPKDGWTKTGRWETLDVLFKLAGGDEKEYALGATHEETVTPLAQKFIFSYRDLPFAVYQIQTKFRNELRAKAGLLRGREFLMKDLYSFHASQEDLDKYYEVVEKAYYKIYERCGLLEMTYLTFAAGGTFSKFSHEFQTITDAGEDKIFICDKCDIAINEEIIAEQKVCPHCQGEKLRTAKAVEVGNIFKLGNKFSQAFGVEFTDEKGEKHNPVMGCYGIGPSRLMGTIAEILHDDKGVIWPEEISPFRVHLLVLGKSAEVRDKAEELYQELSRHDIDVLLDDRDMAAGEKFADADLIGCTYRAVISEKTLKKNNIELKKRSSKNMELVKIEGVADYLR
jgi:prolyl-tRNA synthetase